MAEQFALPRGRMQRLSVLAVAAAGVTTHGQPWTGGYFSGLWTPVSRNQDGSGLTGDAAGVPLTPEGQWRAQSWSPDDFDVAEWVCRPHAFDYSLEGPRSWLRFWPEVDEPTQTLVAYHGHIEMMGQRVDDLDGRPSASAGELRPHMERFLDRRWDGDVLVVTTTHLKEAYIRRSGLMRSDQATVRTRWRKIGDYLQATSILYDPVYLAGALRAEHDDVAPRPRDAVAAVSLRRGDRDRRSARQTSHFLPGQSPLPGLESERDGSVRNASGAEAGGTGDDVSRVHRKDEDVPRPATRVDGHRRGRELGRFYDAASKARAERV